MENFILNLWNAWTFVDLAIMLILSACWYFTNEKKRYLQTEYNYSEFMLKCEQTKFENEQTKSLSLKIESEKRLIELGKLKYVLKMSEDTIKCINDQISRKNQPRDSKGHFAKIKKEPENRDIRQSAQNGSIFQLPCLDTLWKGASQKAIRY